MSQQRIQNLYIARLTTNERPCFICSKFTAVVLTLADNSNMDWFYICRSHLGDTNFCTRTGGEPVSKSVPSSPRKKRFDDPPPVSDSVSDLVASIGSAWNNWRKKSSQDEDKDKKENEDGKKKDKDEDDKKDTNKEEGEKKEENQQKTEGPTSPKSPQQPVRFILQRDYFYMRQREYAKKVQKKEANDRLKTLQFPEVPKTRPQ
ncbi:VPS4-associated protein 1 [Fennellomyces sp. T-0311]|nr:VPS4-associated protein 1 [Fennellomyces sp. T-0311]